MKQNKSGSAPFRAHARLVRLLGEELISDETVAILELVKNSYDADAGNVKIFLENITQPEKGIIQILDDGSGMSLQVVLHSWLEPATSLKRSKNGSKTRTPLGRVSLGEKGIGRFAADKLGSELELITHANDTSDEVVLQVNWHYYEQDSYLDEVENNWFTRSPQQFQNTPGTLLKIQNLRSAWNKEMIVRLYDGLVRLISPFDTLGDFSIELECPEFPEFSGRVVNRLLEAAPYRLVGNIDADGCLHIDIPEPKDIDLRELNREYFAAEKGGLRPSLSGPFSINLNVWDLEPANGKKPGVNNVLRRMIKSRSGVSIYRDGFRVLPYGEPDDDWLELNQRRVNNPTLRVSNNQIIGFVEITHDDNPQLRDRTSREGLLESSAFADLKALVIGAISVLEIRRFEYRHAPYPSPAQASGRKDDIVLQYLDSVRDKPSRNGALIELERLYREKMKQDKVRYSQVVRLAGLGMAAELMTGAFAREVGNATLTFRTLMGEIEGRGGSELQVLIHRLSEQFEQLNEQLDLMEPLYRPSLEGEKYTSVKGVLYDIFNLVSMRLAENRVKVELDGDAQLSVRISSGHLMQVFIILLENSLNAMKEAHIENPRIKVIVLSEKGFNGIRWSDNGPGIASEIRHLIFHPYFSSRRAGRGLGLSVAQDILALYGATLELIQETNGLQGACFEIRFDGRRISKPRSSLDRYNDPNLDMAHSDHIESDQES